MAIKILLLADSHLGFDMPFAPRVVRRRRGPDFFANFRRALAPALQGEVDLVVHGGDLLYRSKVPPALVQAAFEPLLEVADRGVPVYLVPGNHERSAIPYPLLTSHSGIHIFHRPRTFYREVDGFKLALAGFPYFRGDIRGQLAAVLAATGYREEVADGYLLCMHHCVEGAAVGSGGGRDFVFRNRPDTVAIKDLPPVFAAVLSGHIHRFQVLTRDLRGKPAPVPVLYPGSLERTSFAESGEEKGYLVLRVGTVPPHRGRLSEWRFHPLPARPMMQIEIDAGGVSADRLLGRLRAKMAELPRDAVLKIRLTGGLDPAALKIFNAANLRTLAPGMNITLSRPDLKRAAAQSRG